MRRARLRLTFRDIFGKGNFYLEIQDQGVPEEKRIQPNLLKLEQDLGLPLVATNDSHYLCEDDCARAGRDGLHPDRQVDQRHQPAEVPRQPVLREERRGDGEGVLRPRARAGSAPCEIAERCNVRLEKVHDPFPQFEVPAGYTLPDYFEHVTREGFARRLDVLRELQTMGRLKHSLADYEQAAVTRDRASSGRCSSAGILPHRVGLHPLRQGAQHSGRPGPRLGGRVAGGLRARALPTSIRCRTSCSSSAS